MVMRLQLKLLSGIILVIGIFSIYHNYIYGQTVQQQEEEKKVELISHKIERSDENSNKFIGKVQNMINKNVEYIIIIATFYDENGKIIESKSTYTKPNSLKPNMIASFEMMLTDNVPSNNITSYDVTISWRFPGESERYSNVYG
jgi:hypothetical protein